jgi:predicted metal-dependent hydrolase
MLFDFILKQTKPNLEENILTVRGRQIPLATIRNNRARRYLLKLRPDGSARLTIPRRGSVIEGRRFAEKNTDWLAEQLEKLAAHPVEPKQ